MRPAVNHRLQPQLRQKLPKMPQKRRLMQIRPWLIRSKPKLQLGLQKKKLRGVWQLLQIRDQMLIVNIGYRLLQMQEQSKRQQLEN